MSNTTPLQLDNVINYIKESFFTKDSNFSITPLFQEANEFHGEIWRIKLEVLFGESSSDIVTTLLFWDESITVEIAQKYFAHQIFLIYRSIMTAYTKGIRTGSEITQKVINQDIAIRNLAMSEQACNNFITRLY